MEKGKDVPVHKKGNKMLVKIFLITFLLLYAHLQIMQAVYHLFHIEQAVGLNPFMLLKMILPLKIIFEQPLEKGKFPKIWKKAKMFLFIKKETKCW